MIVSSTRRPRSRACRAALALTFLVLVPTSALAQRTAAPRRAVPDSLDRMNQAIDALTQEGVAERRPDHGDRLRRA